MQIEASDGFNTTDATSQPFRALGAPPAVAIIAPARGFSQPNDAALLLDGTAFDDAGQQLTGARLHWFDGQHRLGTGDSLSVSGLPARAQTIRLLATDPTGRKATATVRIALRQAPPSFVTIRAPARIAKSAKQLTITITASIPSHLTLTGSGAPTRPHEPARAHADDDPTNHRAQRPHARAEAHSRCRTVPHHLHPVNKEITHPRDVNIVAKRIVSPLVRSRSLLVTEGCSTPSDLQPFDASQPPLMLSATCALPPSVARAQGRWRCARSAMRHGVVVTAAGVIQYHSGAGPAKGRSRWRLR